MNEVKRFLRAGMGLCQGQSCNKTVRAIIAQELGISPTETDVITARSPVRPVPHGCLWKRYILSKISGRWQR